MKKRWNGTGGRKRNDFIRVYRIVKHLVCPIFYDFQRIYHLEDIGNFTLKSPKIKLMCEKNTCTPFGKQKSAKKCKPTQVLAPMLKNSL